jgi:pimeloyl-ACP methyl ester carboxylesterase
MLDERQQDFPTPTMRVGGIDVFVEGAGSESIVFVHGWPDTHRLWDRPVEALRHRYRCVRFSLPGFDAGHPRQAYSLDEVVDIIRQVVERAAEGRPVTLLLHDWGCVFGYQFALRYPHLVGRVVGVDVGDAGSRRNLGELGLKAKAMVVAYQFWLAVAWRIGGRIGDWMARTMARLARAPGDPASIGSRMGYPYYVQWVQRGYRQARSFRPACPMLFVYGRRKPFMFHSSAWADEVAADPRNRVLAFDSGHWVMIERADEFNRAVAAWLEGSGDAG